MPMRTPRSDAVASGTSDAVAADTSAAGSMRPRCARVAASRASTPLIAASTSAASRTVRHIGPAVSCVNEIGTMPSRLTRPTVGLMPTSAFTDAGEVIEPSVSVPMPAAHRLAATAAPVPDDEPLGLRSSA